MSDKIMSESDFDKAFHVRKVERCCSSCRYGEDEIGCTATCKHPKRNDNGQAFDEELSKYIISNTFQSNVCDLFEGRKKNNEQ